MPEMLQLAVADAFIAQRLSVSQSPTNRYGRSRDAGHDCHLRMRRRAAGKEGSRRGTWAQLVFRRPVCWQLTAVVVLPTDVSLRSSCVEQ